MKFLVDKLPTTCGECEYCADAMVPTALGVPKQVKACTLKTLTPPTENNSNEPIVEERLSPVENACPCVEFGTTPNESVKKTTDVEVKNGVTKSGIIL